MTKAKKFIVPVGNDAQKTYDFLVDEQEQAWDTWVAAREEAGSYFKTLLPKGYEKANLLSNLDRHDDVLIDGYLVLHGSIKSEEE